MGALSNPRHERFAQLLKQGIPACHAYTGAGFKPHRGNSVRLRASENVQRRLAELTRHIAVETKVTIASLTAMFVEDREFAHKHENPSAAHAASVSIGKLHGLMVDRKESGQPGDFAALATREEVEAQIRAELGEEAATLFRNALGVASASDQAEPDTTRH